MSTYVYLYCLEHDPPIQADDASENHVSLRAIRKDIAQRERIVKVAREIEDMGLSIDWDLVGQYRRSTILFLIGHPSCRIGIKDEFGDWYSTTGDSNEPIPGPLPEVPE